MTALRVIDNQTQATQPKRIAENLVLEGYRRWCVWGRTEEHAHWQVARDHFTSTLGRKEGQFALLLFVEFMSKLHKNSFFTFKSMGFGCQSLCFHEVILLGLFSGIQHDDETAITLCIDGLTANKNPGDEVQICAEAFASFLFAHKLQLFPIPACTIKTILTEKISTSTLQ